MKTSPGGRSITSGVLVAAAVALVALVVTLWGAVVSWHARPLDGVEGDLLFEASRIRAGLALYTDPAVGAADYGPIPARYYVLYPPLWAGFLSLWPSDVAATLARVVSSVAWWGVLAWLAATARPRCRVPAALAAAFVGGVYSLAEFGGSARPDAVAVALAGVALARTVRRGQVDALAGALFALAAWTKPNIVGMGAGAFAACALSAPRSFFRAALGAAAVSLLAAGVLQIASSGAWVAHLLAGTGQPLRAHLFVHHLEARAQFFLFLLGLAALFAVEAARGQRGGSGGVKWGDAERESGRVALAALLASVAWSFFTFAKIGSAANYWMEPCVAAVVVFAHVPAPAMSVRGRLALAVALPLQALWTGVGSVRATLESVAAHREHARLLERARGVCEAAPDVLVVADEPGIEMALNGRLVAHAFTLTHQALRGELDVAPWLRDLQRPEIGCVVTAHDRIERPPSSVDPDYDYFAPPVRAVLSARFAPAEARAGWEIYAPRSRPGNDR